jgi:excisionase family DNA binding protein
MLARSGWVVVDRNAVNWSVGLGLAVREYPTDVGPADYVLFVDQEPVGVIEAKEAAEYFAILVRTVYRLIDEGELNRTKIRGCLGVPLAEIRRYERELEKRMGET